MSVFQEKTKKMVRIDITSLITRRLKRFTDFRIVMQGEIRAGNNEQQNVVHREAIEAGGKLFGYCDK
jgi:hypothetical protein